MPEPQVTESWITKSQLTVSKMAKATYWIPNDQMITLTVSIHFKLVIFMNITAMILNSDESF